MRKLEAVEIETSDIQDLNDVGDDVHIAISHADVVIFKGEVVKNRSGKITATFSEMLTQERNARA